MPALFAYLIALGLLLGGGYGALNWLATPEPVKIVARAKPVPRPHFDEANREPASEPSPQEAQKASPETTIAETVGPRDLVAGSNHPPAAPPAEASTASTEQATQPAVAAAPQMAQAQISAPAPIQQNPAVNAEVASTETARPPEHAQPAEVTSAGSPTSAASATPLAAAKTVKPKRPHQQRLASRSEKTALVPMTLRTIEFPDGRRVTQLLPYRGDDRD
jgi:hypothetical protein